MKNKIRLWSIGTIALAIITISAFAFVSCGDNLQPTLTGIGISPSSLNLEVNETGQLAASPIPATALLGTVTWTSSNPLIASVNNTGLVTGLSPGTAIITAIFDLAGGSITVTVSESNPVVLTGIGISPSPLNLDVAATGQLTAAPIPATAALGTVTWTSDNPLIASVNSTGLVTGVAPGNTVIRASSGTATGSVNVAVLKPNVLDSIGISPSPLNLDVAATGQLTAAPIPATAALGTVTWISDNSLIATVDSTGLVTAVAIGNTTIRASSGTATGSVNVNVAGAAMPDEWKRVFAGPDHSFGIGMDGSLWAWGMNGHGRTGLNTNAGNTYYPARVGTWNDWVYVSAGSQHSLGIRGDGSLWAWGNNFHGRTGLGTAAGSELYPKRVGNAYNWASVSAGGIHSLAVTTTGELWAWGGGTNWQTGFGGTAANITSPQNVGLNMVEEEEIAGMEDGWASVSAGDNFSLAVRTDGSLWAWGNNNHGRTGLNATGQFNNTPIPTRVGSANNWASVSAGNQHSLAVTTTGELWAWGNNANARTGLDTTLGETLTPERVGDASNWASASAGTSHSLAVTTDGQLWAWGSNANGRTGRGAEFAGGNTLTPARVGSLTGWSSPSAGGSHSHAIRGEFLYAWGLRTNGRAGLGHHPGGEGQNVLVPTRVGN